MRFMYTTDCTIILSYIGKIHNIPLGKQSNRRLEHITYKHGFKVNPQSRVFALIEHIFELIEKALAFFVILLARARIELL